MRVRTLLLAVCVVAVALLSGCGLEGFGQKTGPLWEVHDMNRPAPLVVRPGTTSTPSRPGQAPGDAIVLFDGTDATQWVEDDKDGGPIKWKVKNGYMEVVPKTGSIRTKKSFGSCQLHLEWAAPPRDLKRKSQGLGNSGVYLMSLYELQILDSRNNRTYADGYAGAMYGQNPPLVNVSLPPAQWQTYDIIFHRPVFKNGKVKKAATITVFHNNVLVQDNFKIWGKTVHKRRAKYAAHADKMPLGLQNHRDAVRYRNIWIRPLED